MGRGTSLPCTREKIERMEGVGAGHAWVLCGWGWVADNNCFPLISRYMVHGKGWILRLDKGWVITLFLGGSWVWGSLFFLSSSLQGIRCHSVAAVGRVDIYDCSRCMTVKNEAVFVGYIYGLQEANVDSSAFQGCCGSLS